MLHFKEHIQGRFNRALIAKRRVSQVTLGGECRGSAVKTRQYYPIRRPCYRAVKMSAGSEEIAAEPSTPVTRLAARVGAMRVAKIPNRRMIGAARRRRNARL